MTEETRQYTFDPVDIDQMRLRGSLSPTKRIQGLLDARALIVGVKRGRMRKRYPTQSDREKNLKLIEELSHDRTSFPVLSQFYDGLLTLVQIDFPYIIIGAFVGKPCQMNLT